MDATSLRSLDQNKTAFDAMTPVAYQELRRLAGSFMKGEPARQTLQPTALVHEAYIRLMSQQQPEFKDRRHFYAVAARVMRQILVDRARARNAQKRGGGWEAVTLDVDAAFAFEDPERVLMLDEVLGQLEESDPEKARIIELRYFIGLSATECIETLGMPPATFYRHLRLAEAWLARELDRKPATKAE